MAIPWLALLGLGGNLFGSLFGAKKQSDAADRSAQIMADAQRYIAELTGKANADALAFQRGIAQNAFDNSEVGRRMDYGQFAAKEGRLGYLGDLMGLPKREIPAFIPGANPNFGGGSSGGGMYPSRPENMPKPGEVDWNSPQLSSQLSAFFKSRGVADSEVPYWVSKAGELVARGKEINDPNYANMRLAAAEIFGGGGGSAAPPPSAGLFSPYVPTRQASVPFLNSVQPAALRRPQTIGSYF